MDEKRMYQRYACSLSGDFQLTNNTSGLFNCSDISLQGAGILTAKPLPVNSSIKINCLTKMNALLSVIGKVTWSGKVKTGWQAGIMFEKPLMTPLEIIL